MTQVWKPATDKAGKPYWYNPATKKTSRIDPNSNHPDIIKTSTSKKTGKMYWYNVLTKETFWEDPNGTPSDPNPSPPSIDDLPPPTDSDSITQPPPPSGKKVKPPPPSGKKVKPPPPSASKSKPPPPGTEGGFKLPSLADASSPGNRLKPKSKSMRKPKQSSSANSDLAAKLAKRKAAAEGPTVADTTQSQSDDSSQDSSSDEPAPNPFKSHLKSRSSSKSGHRSSPKKSKSKSDDLAAKLARRKAASGDPIDGTDDSEPSSKEPSREPTPEPVESSTPSVSMNKSDENTSSFKSNLKKSKTGSSHHSKRPSLSKSKSKHSSKSKSDDLAAKLARRKAASGDPIDGTDDSEPSSKEPSREPTPEPVESSTPSVSMNKSDENTSSFKSNLKKSKSSKNTRKAKQKWGANSPTQSEDTQSVDEDEPSPREIQSSESNKKKWAPPKPGPGGVGPLVVDLATLQKAKKPKGARKKISDSSKSVSSTAPLSSKKSKMDLSGPPTNKNLKPKKGLGSALRKFSGSFGGKSNSDESPQEDPVEESEEIPTNSSETPADPPSTTGKKKLFGRLKHSKTEAVVVEPLAPSVEKHNTEPSKNTKSTIDNDQETKILHSKISKLEAKVTRLSSDLSKAKRSANSSAPSTDVKELESKIKTLEQEIIHLSSSAKKSTQTSFSDPAEFIASSIKTLGDNFASLRTLAVLWPLWFQSADQFRSSLSSIPNSDSLFDAWFHSCFMSDFSSADTTGGSIDSKLIAHYSTALQPPNLSQKVPKSHPGPKPVPPPSAVLKAMGKSTNTKSASSSSSVSISSLSALECARQLKILSHSLISRLNFEDIFKTLFTTSKKHVSYGSPSDPDDVNKSFIEISSSNLETFLENAPSNSFTNHIQHWNHIVQIVWSQILDAGKVEDAALVLATWINIAYHSISLHNFDASSAIITALNSPPIARLDKVWKKISQSDYRQFELMDDIFNSSDFYFYYFIALNKAVQKTESTVDKSIQQHSSPKKSGTPIYQSLIIPWLTPLVEIILTKRNQWCSNFSIESAIASSSMFDILINCRLVRPNLVPIPEFQNFFAPTSSNWYTSLTKSCLYSLEQSSSSSFKIQSRSKIADGGFETSECINDVLQDLSRNIQENNDDIAQDIHYLSANF